jgi:hypothetical protein
MIEPVLNKFDHVIFLDHDGVLNCQLFYDDKFAVLERYDGVPLYKIVKKYLRRQLKQKQLTDLEYYKSETCEKRIGLLNWLCKETNSAVVISASMRSSWSVEDLQKIFNYCGATFTIIDKTGYCADRVRGVEIYNWLKDNSDKWFGQLYFDFHRYAIIDDDSDMLLNQQYNFFQCDKYCGLTPTIVERIKIFFTHKTF